MSERSRTPPLHLVILDMDGVLYRGDRPVDGAVELVHQLHNAGLLVRYATNNSMHTRATYVRRLLGMGITAGADEIVTSTSATVDHLRHHEPEVRSLLAVGAEGMVDELRAAGYRAVSAADVIAGAVEAPAVDAVLVGLDPDFDDRRQAVAAAAITAGARFIATNADARYPTPSGWRPGAGAVVDAIAAATGRQPLVIGKPAPAMFTTILETAGVSAAEALVVGDNPDSDIAGARRAGIESVLVLTGVTGPEAAGDLTGERRPDHVVDDPAAAWRVIRDRIGR